MPNHAIVLLLALLQATTLYARSYQRCVLAKELKNEYHVSDNLLPTWLCIAYHESYFNTHYRSLYNADDSQELGLFGLNSYNCCAPHSTKCNMTRDNALDDSIKDDFACAKIIYRETAKPGVSGFSAWTSYKKHCTDKEKVAKYLKECFD